MPLTTVGKRILGRKTGQNEFRLFIHGGDRGALPKSRPGKRMSRARVDVEANHLPAGVGQMTSQGRSHDAQPDHTDRLRP